MQQPESNAHHEPYWSEALAHSADAATNYVERQGLPQIPTEVPGGAEAAAKSKLATVYENNAHQQDLADEHMQEEITDHPDSLAG